VTSPQKPTASEPGKVMAEAEKRADAEAREANKRRERVFEVTVKLRTLIQAARNERQRRGEHCSDEDLALFLATNEVSPPKDLGGVYRVPESWPRTGLIERLDRDDG
jgi:hypothetical protein